MKTEELFLAIGEIQDTLLLQSQYGASPADLMEDKTVKKNHLPRRTLRNLMIAAAIVSTLAVTAFAAAGFLLYDSPMEMLKALYGDETGFDHKDVTYLENPGKPQDPMANPAYHRVPADETLAQEVAPHVSSLGQSLSCGSQTLTVDALMYDAATHCGLLTYTLEDTGAFPEYWLQPDGQVTYAGVEPLSFSQGGYSYVIQEKTTSQKLTAVYYFRCDGLGAEELEIHFRAAEPGEEELNQFLQEVRQELTPEEAQAQAKKALGEDYALLIQEYSGAELEDLCYQAAAGIRYKAFYDQKMESMEKLTIPLDASSMMNHVTFDGGSVILSPIAITVDTLEMDFLRTDEHFLSGSEVDELVLQFRDGSLFTVRSDEIQNATLANVHPPYGQAEGPYSLVTYMFNRMVDAEDIVSVFVNGTELKPD